MKTKETLLFLPQGVYDLLPEFAKKLRFFENTIRSILTRSGYEEVVPPLFEYLDNFLTAAGKVKNQEDIIKFVDLASGRLIGLRHDFTPQVVRLVASHFRFTTKPRRLFYIGPIYRHARGNKNAEVYQAGAELIGPSDIRSDAEILDLTQRIIAAMGVEEFTIYVSDARFMRNIFHMSQLSIQDKEELKIALKQRNGEYIEFLVKRSLLDECIKEVLIELPFLFGTIEDLNKRSKRFEWPALRKTIEELDHLMSLVKEMNAIRNNIIIDLGSYPKHDYYTGVFFEVHLPKVLRNIALGGRYDQLFSFFGENVPAVGVGLTLSDLIYV